MTLENFHGTDIINMRSKTKTKTRSFKLVTLAIVIFGLFGCAPNTVTMKAVEDYEKAYSKISIGDARGHVLAILDTSQQVIPLRFKKRPGALFELW